MLFRSLTIGNRQKTPSELEQQFPIVREILKAMNIKALESPIYEADDIAGTITSLANENDIEAILLTGDRDYFQLANKNTKILFTKNGVINYFRNSTNRDSQGLINRRINNYYG